MTMGKAEITVRGAGAFGLACAYELVRRGARVRLIEREHLGAGASGGHVGALAPHVPEQWNEKKQFQFESLIAAQGFWDQVRADGGLDAGYGRVGRLQALENDAAVARARERGLEAQGLWRGEAVWEVRNARDFAFAPLSPTGLVIHDTLSARAAPRAAGRALLTAFQALGGEYIEGEAQDHGQVLHACGSEGLAELTEALGRPIGIGEKGQSALLQFDMRAAPQIYADGLHIVGHADGTVAIGSTSERSYADLNTDAQLEALIARARAALPALANAPVIDRWAGARPRATTRAPLLGAWPDREGHFVANGGFKIGFGIAPKVAQVMADLLLEGRNMIPEAFQL